MIGMCLSRGSTDHCPSDVGTCSGHLGWRMGLGLWMILAAFESSPAQTVYTDIAQEAGIDVDRTDWAMSIGDIDSDGFADLYINTHTTEGLFFRNVPESPLSFESFDFEFDRREEFDHGDQHTAALVYVDGDTCLDLSVAQGSGLGQQERPNWLLSLGCGTRVQDGTARAGTGDDRGRGRAPIWLDVDLDGIADFVQLNHRLGGHPTRLYRGRGDGRFDDWTEGSGLDIDADMDGGVAVDLDDDRDPDLVLCGRRVYVYRNNGDGTFTDVTLASNVHVIGATARAVAGDINGDEIPDLVIFDRKGPGGVRMTQDGELRYILPLLDAGHSEVTFRTDSDTLEFVSYMIGGQDPDALNRRFTFLGAEGVHPHRTPFVFPDPTVFSPHSFEDVFEGAPAQLVGGMGIFLWKEGPGGPWHLRAIADGRNFPRNRRGMAQYAKGWFRGNEPITDIFVDAQVPPDTTAIRYVFLGNGDLTFHDASNVSGLRGADVPVNDVALADFDNDGDSDLYLATGTGVFNEPDEVYLNDGTGVFVPSDGWLSLPREPRGSADLVAVADFDIDGSLEIVVHNGGGIDPFTGPVNLYRADGIDGHWLQIDLRPLSDGPTALGTRVSVSAGGRTQVRHWTQGQGNRSQDEAVLHFGIGNAEIIDRLEIEWPNGAMRTLTEVAIDQRIRIPVDW